MTPYLEPITEFLMLMSDFALLVASSQIRYYLLLAVHVKAKMWPTFLHYLYWLYASCLFKGAFEFNADKIWYFRTTPPPYF